MNFIQKTFTAVFFAALIIALFSNCDKNTTPQGKFITFDQHIESVKNADFDAYKKLPYAIVLDEAAFEKMKTHILSMYEGVTVPLSFVGTDGAYVDCIPFEQQPSLRGVQSAGQEEEAAAAQPENESEKINAKEHTNSVDIRLKANDMDEFGNERFCPKGCIPMLRLQLDIMVRYKTLEDFFSKTGSVDSDTDIEIGDRAAVSHYYAHAYKTVNNYGGESWLNLWNPTVSLNKFSLSQQWWAGGTGAALQTVEGGWQRYPSFYAGAATSRLFIYFTNANYAAGSGGYNLTVPGFVQVSPAIVLGGAFPNYSSTNGAQYDFGMQWKRAINGNWQLFYKTSNSTTYVGYYPKAKFNNGQMSLYAKKFDVGGETIGEPAARQMGSGAFANQGFAKAAYQRNMFYISTANISTWATPLTTQLIPAAGCYSITSPVSGGAGAWVNYFYYGGPSCF